MKVYVLETGPWEAQGIYGVYATPEAAMAAWPKGAWEKVENDAGYDLWRLGGQRLADTAKITGYNVEGERPNPVNFSDAGTLTVTWPVDDPDVPSEPTAAEIEAARGLDGLQP